VPEGHCEVSDVQPDRLRGITAIAYEAQTLAKQAVRDIEQHEDVCAERYGNIHKALAEMKVEFKEANAKTSKTFWWMFTTGFAILISLLGFLLKAQIDTIAEMAKATAQRSVIMERTRPTLPPQVIIQPAPGQSDMGATVERGQ
jgi:hypothetical protein